MRTLDIVIAVVDDYCGCGKEEREGEGEGGNSDMRGKMLLAKAKDSFFVNPIPMGTGTAAAVYKKDYKNNS